MADFIKKMFILFLAVFFPWIIFLMNDNPGAAFISLALQATVIGWPFASAWAWKTHYSPQEEAKGKTKKEAREETKEMNEKK